MRAARRRVADGDGRLYMYWQWWADTNAEKHIYVHVDIFMYICAICMYLCLVMGDTVDGFDGDFVGWC